MLALIVATAVAFPSLPAAPASPQWQAPVAPVVVIRAFTPPSAPWAPGHRGVDLASNAGATVRAAGPGTVRFAGMLAGRFVVSIAHLIAVPGRGTGWRTTYEGVRPSVSVGDELAAGQPIGLLDPKGAHCFCLHWGLRRGTDYADPMMLLSGPVVLKPDGSRARVRLLE